MNQLCSFNFRKIVLFKLMLVCIVIATSSYIGISRPINTIGYFLCNDLTGEYSYHRVAPFIIEENECTNAINLANGTTDSGTNVGSTQSSGETVPPGLVAPISSVWYTFVMPPFGSNRVNITIASGTIQNPVVSFYTNGCPGILVKQVDFQGFAFPKTLQLCLPPGIYTVQVATNAGDEGTYDLKLDRVLQGTPNDGCDSLNLPLFTLAGPNIANNTCSLDGYVWYKYVHQGGPSADNVQISTFDGNYVINSIFLSNCANPLPPNPCLKNGDVLYIEVGSMINFGPFSVNIQTLDNAIANDDCIDVAGNILNCSNSLSGSGNLNACTDKTYCPNLLNKPIVWDKILVDPTVNTFDIIGFNFEIFTGPCSDLVSFACGGDPNLVGIDATIYGDEFYIATAPGGNWTATANPGVPPNTDCPEPFNPGTPLYDEITVRGSTTCAPPGMIEFCDLNTTTDHYVYYIVWTPHYITDIEIKVVASGYHPANDLKFALLEGCSGKDGKVVASSCDGDSIIRLECVYPLSSFPVVVASAEGPGLGTFGEGDFEITANITAHEGPDNDLCTFAEEIPHDNLSNVCKWDTIAGDLTNACTEDFVSTSGCIFESAPTIWYKITVTNEMTGFEFRNLTPGLSIGLFEDGCVFGTFDFSPDQIGGCITEPSFIPLLPGTYLISVSGEEGPFSFDLLVTNPPPNDLCLDVKQFNINTLTPGHNFCATQLTDVFPTCAEGDQYGVWYSYNVVKDVKTITLEVKNFSSNGTLNVAAFKDCTGTYYNNEGSYNQCGNEVIINIDCPIQGTTIYFMVSSTLEEEGSFDLIVTETQQILVPNDDCVASILWEPPRCQAVKYGPYSNVTACPEPFDDADCGIDEQETVWFKIKLPDDAKTMDIGISEYSGSGRAAFLLFENCDGFGLDHVCHGDISSGYVEKFGAHVNVEAYKGKTIYLAYLTEYDEGGDVIFDVKVNTPPPNDEICKAQTIVDTLTEGTTFCAYNDIPNFPCTVRDDNQVWYSYKVKSGENGFSVKLQNTGLGGPFAVALMKIDTNCTHTPILLDSTAFKCNIGTKAMVADCLAPGDSILILVSTATVGMGEFILELIPTSENTTCYDNASCSTALDLGIVITDAACLTKMDCNITSCPIQYDLCPGLDELHNVVWFRLQNDGNGEYLSVDVNSTSFKDPVVILFKGDDCNNLTMIGPCTTGSDSTAATGPVQIDITGANPALGENYFVAIGSKDLSGGDFTYCVELISGCVNDLSCDAANLVPNAPPIANPASTINCSGDLINTSCPGASVNTVWYKFTIPKGMSTATINVSNSTIVGTTSIQIGEWTLADCNTPEIPIFSGCNNIDNFSVQLFCLKEEQTYYIQLGSAANMNAGDFNIQVLTNPSLSQNDFCSQAIDLLSGNEPYCEFVARQGTTLNACPDDFSYQTCHFDESNTVWYAVTIPNDPTITAMDIEVRGLSISKPYFAILEDDCQNHTAILPSTECISANANNLAAIYDVKVDAGATYLIPISGKIGSIGSFEIRVKLLSPPANDRCLGAFTLPMETNLDGHNNCATNDGVYDFTNCPQILNDADVWFIMPIDRTLYDAYTINLSNWAGNGNIGIEVFGSTVTCNAIPLNVSQCSSNGNVLLTVPISCLDPAIQSLYIKIGSAKSNTGDFQLRADGVDKLVGEIHAITLCEGGPVINLNDSIFFNQPGVTGYWSTNAVNALAGNFFTPLNVVPGIYDLMFTLDNNPGGSCDKIITSSIEITGLPFVEKSMDGSPCNKPSSNGSTVLNLHDLLKPGYAPGVWSQVSGTPTINILANGETDFDGVTPYAQFVFSYTTTSAILPCSNITVLVNVTVDNCDCPNVITFAPQDICNTSNTFDLNTLQSPNLAPGIWKVKQGASNVPVTNNQFINVGGLNGDYTLTYTLNPPPAISSCPKESVQTLHVEKQNTAQLNSGNVQICNVDRGSGENLLDLTSLVGVGSSSGQWLNSDNAPIDFSNPANLVFGNTVNLGDKFTFTYVVQNNPPCTDAYYDVEVEIKSCLCSPLSPLNPGIHCATEGVLDLSLYDDIQRSGGTWSSPQLTIVNNKLDLSVVNEGSYTIIYTPTDLEPNCDPAERTIEVNIQSNSGSATGLIQRCYGTSETINLFDLLSQEDVGGTWNETTAIPSTGNAFNAANGTFKIDNVSVNTFSFEYSFDNALPCGKTSTTVIIKINNIPVADAGKEDTLTCTQTTANLGLISSSGPNISYAWTHAGGKQVPNADKAMTTVNFGGSFTLTVTDINSGCSATDQVTINESPDRPSATIESKNITCFGDKDGSLKFTDIISIHPPLKFSIDNGVTYSDIPDFTKLSSGTYSAVLKDANGCLFKETITLTEPPLLAFYAGKDTLVLRGTYVEINLENQIDTHRISHIIWTLKDDNGESVVCEKPDESCLIYGLEVTVNSLVCVEISDDEGCTKKECVKIDVIKSKNFQIPNIISPTSTDNNKFIISSDDIEIIHDMKIFDRWGNQIYAAHNFLPGDPVSAWDGTINGTTVVDGVYVWQLIFTYKDDGERKVLTGDVTVVK